MHGGLFQERSWAKFFATGTVVLLFCAPVRSGNDCSSSMPRAISTVV
jgi:hypothetical protein